MIPRALTYRRYRLLWIGMLISLSGARMQAAAVLWHVNEITGQPIALGGVGLAHLIPVVALSLPAGALADVFNRRRLMFMTQASLAILAAILAALTLTGQVSLWIIYTIIGLMGAVQSFDLPARQSLVPNLVPRSALTNAFSMNSIAFQFGSIVGPAAGGLMIAGFSIGHAYLFNALTYLAVIVALVRMGPVEQETDRAGAGIVETLQGMRISNSMREGFQFVFRQPIIFSSMLLDFFATFFSSATALLPIFAKDILFVGAVGYGWLAAAPAIGAAAAAVPLSLLPQVRRQGPILLGAVGLFGVATIIFGVSRAFWVTFGALVMTGATDGVSAIIRNTIRQLQTPDRLRGRMTSVNQIFFMGGPQLGEIEAGLVAQFLGAPFAVISGGIGCLLATGWIGRRYPQLRGYDGDEPTLAGDQALHGEAA